MVFSSGPGKDSVFGKRRTEIYEGLEEIGGISTEVSVYNVYGLEGEGLGESFHESEYIFRDSGEDLKSRLEEFREQCTVSWYGDRLYPAVTDFRETPSISLHMPYSRAHSKTMEKVKATEFTQVFGEELDKYLKTY